jgi:peroxiredoxin
MDMGQRWQAAFLAASLLLTNCQKNNQGEAESNPAPAKEASSGLEVKDRFGPGMTFPHVPIIDQMGNRYDLYNLLSKPHNLVLFIDAYCAACGEESEKIQGFAAGRPDINVIGVARDSFPAILNFKTRHKLLFPILRDGEDQLVPDYRRVLFPTLVLAGSDKKVIQLYEGQISPEKAAPLLKALLGL